MDQYFRDAVAGIKQTTDGLRAASQGLIAAIDGINKTADAMLTAQEEHENLRVTVARLETELLQLSKEFREYRNGQL